MYNAGSVVSAALQSLTPVAHVVVRVSNLITVLGDELLTRHKPTMRPVLLITNESKLHNVVMLTLITNYISPEVEALRLLSGP